VDGELPGPTYEGGRMTVNAIAPGYVATKMSDGLAAWGVTTENTAAKTPLGRMGLATDMAGAALYLASPAGAWTSGVVLPVDGGILSTPLSLGDVEPN
jgi:NAD(P)-dependent dehydrogenase (short-subunit alcohol dehydrogenase family)